MYRFLIHDLCCIKMRDFWTLIVGLLIFTLPAKAQNNNALWQNNTACIYKSRINLYGNNFSGMMVIKRDSADLFRTVFMNEVGMKYFDFEIGVDSFRSVHIFEPMNRKMLTAFLSDVYRLMLFVPKMPTGISKTDKKGLLKYKTGRKVILYDSDKKLPIEIYRRGWWRKVRQLCFSEYKDHTPGHILIRSRGVRFTQEFELLKK